MRLIATSLVISGLFIARVQAQDTNTPAQPSLAPPQDQTPAPPAPTSPAPVAPPPPAPATEPAPAPPVATAPAPAPAPAPSFRTTASTPATVTTTTTKPHAETTHADHFYPESIIDRCMDGVTLSESRFNRHFSGEVVEFTGTVADINHDENLVVFQGGGVYPENWDVQLKPHGQKFAVGRTYHVTFRLTRLRDEPLAGYSFRGIVLHRTLDE